jgi:molecular chaperone GrpE (heat shock protein)
MLAELAAFTAAMKTVEGTIRAGKSLASAAQSIGKMAESKDILHQRLQKKKNSPFSRQVETDLEEFMALEQIREAEARLKEIMIYTGRAGLHGDFVKYQADARKARKEAERQAQKQREEMIETITAAVGVFLGFVLLLGGLASLIWYVKGF